MSADFCALSPKSSTAFVMSFNAGNADFNIDIAKPPNNKAAAPVFLDKNSAKNSNGVIKLLAATIISLKAVCNLAKGFVSLSAFSLNSPKLFANCSETSLKTAVLLCAIVNLSATNPLACANFLVATSNLSMIPNSSSSSGSAFVTPRTSLLKESVKSLPKATEASFAPSANSSTWSALKPAADVIAAD